MEAFPHSELGRFPTTTWALVERGQEALGEVFQRYQPAIRKHLIFVKGVARHDVEDLIQGFVSSQMIESDLLARADQCKGKFRTLLLTALDRYLANDARHHRSTKRTPRNGRIHSMDDSAFTSHPTAVANADTFDIEWARQILNETTSRMQSCCEMTGQNMVWEVFKARLLNPIANHEPVPDYESLRVRLKLRSPLQASNLLVTAKRMYSRFMRSVVAEYVQSDEEIEEEISTIFAILSNGRA